MVYERKRACCAPAISALSDAGGARELCTCPDRIEKKRKHIFVLASPHALKMVVVNSEPGTSTPKRKNRRSLHKKKSVPVSEPMAQSTGDQEMEPVDQEVYDPEPQAPTSTAGARVERDQSGGVGDDDEVMIDTDPSAAALPPSSAPSFPALTGSALQTSLKSEMRRIPIPPHRMSPLKKDWINIFGPLTEILGLQVRMNVHRKSVEIRVSSLPSVSHSTVQACLYFYFGR